LLSIITFWFTEAQKQEQPPNVKKPKSILKTESRSDTNQKITLEDKKIEVSDKDKAHVITEF
jgi:hypothetical protein